MSNATDIKKVEENLQKLFKKFGISGEFSVDEVKNLIYNSRGRAMDAVHKYHKKVLSSFPRVKNIDQMNEILQVFTDAWNVFPHKALKGKSPNQLVAECGDVHNKVKDGHMPDIVVGGHKMKWDDYWVMLKKMEELQKPFKYWIENEFLPRYKKYLVDLGREDGAGDYYTVAEVFFDRILHVGFLNLEQVRIEFVQTEFPLWWPTHIMDIDLKPAQIRVRLKALFDFLELAYGVPVGRYGWKMK